MSWSLIDSQLLLRPFSAGFFSCVFRCSCRSHIGQKLCWHQWKTRVNRGLQPLQRSTGV